MYILMDTREKPQATRKIVDYFQQNQIDYERTKLRVGDYQDISNPYLVIDRKKDFEELAANCCRDHVRFRNELQRAEKTGTTIFLLIEQNRFRSQNLPVQVHSIEDLMTWQSRYGVIRGEQVYRVLRSWLAKYPLRIDFCDKRSTGRRIVEILKEAERA